MTVIIVIVVIAIVLFVVFCALDTAQKVDDAADHFARFEDRSPGMTDVDK